MNKLFFIRVLAGLTVAALYGCGGGGGGGGATLVSKAATKVYLFGNITGAGKIVASVKSTMNVPDGVLINYSSTPGATSGLCKLRRGAVVPSGPVKVSGMDSNDTFGTYDIGRRLLTINLVNISQDFLKSSTTANNGAGMEIATVNFTLVTPGVTPAAMPLKDSAAEIGQFILSPPDLSYPAGNEINFSTTYQ
jgi:hypothetical protein